MTDADTIKALRKVARELSIFALHMSGGGSEMFKTVAGEQYADADECRKRADHRRDSVERIHDMRLKGVIANRDMVSEALIEAHKTLRDCEYVLIEYGDNYDGPILEYVQAAIKQASAVLPPTPVPSPATEREGT